MIDDDFDDFYDDDDLDCDCSEYEIDTMDGRVWCMRCDRRRFSINKHISGENLGNDE